MKAVGVIGLVLGFCMFAFAFGEDTTKAICWTQVAVGLVGLAVLTGSATFLEHLDKKKEKGEKARRLYQGNTDLF